MENENMYDEIVTKLELEINKTPTGELRELLTSVNIALQTLILERQWHKPEDLPDELVSRGLKDIKLIVKYKIRNRVFIDFGHKNEYEWHVSGSPSDYSDCILGWMCLPSL